MGRQTPMVATLTRGSWLSLTLRPFFAILLCFPPTLCCDFLSFLNSTIPAHSIAVKMGGPGVTVVVVADLANVFFAASQ